MVGPRQHVHQPSLGAKIIAAIEHEAKQHVDDLTFWSAGEIGGIRCGHTAVPSSAGPRKNGCECQLPPETKLTAAPARPGVCNDRGTHPRQLPSPGHKGRWGTTSSFRPKTATRSAREGGDMVCRRDVLRHPTAILQVFHRESLRSAQ